MKTEATLLAEIAAAATLREQASLVAELDALRQSKTAQKQADRDWDAAGAVVEQTLTPVLTHSFHTASTDWLSEAEIPAVDSNLVHAQASLWFGKTSSMVKADAEEFSEQAKGVARRVASQYGEQAGEAERLFMDYVAFLHRREGASGLDQIQQTVAPDGVTKKTTPLPEDTYDTFQDPIAPENQGVDEMQSTESAPLLNEILNNAPGHGTPEVGYQHEESQTFEGPTTNGSGFPVGASLVDAPSVAHGYLYNLDDFLASQAAIQTHAGRESADDAESSPTTSSTDLTATAAGHPDPKDCSHKTPGTNKSAFEAGRCALCGVRSDHPGAAKKEAASGLDQVEQVVDSQENPKPTPLPLDVAFPLIPYFEQGGKKQSVKIASSVEEMLTQQGSDNPMNDKTHVGGEKAAAEPTNAMEKATKHSSLDKTAASDYRKGATFAANWKPGDNIVTQGSDAFEAGLYAGITANAAAQEAWLAEHERWGLGARIARHQEITDSIVAMAGTTSDLEEMTPGNGLNDGPHALDAPINGPGTVPPLDGGMDPAAPGGASPYNGAAPYSKPVAPDPGWMNPQQRRAAFLARVQAGLQEREA